MARRVLEVPMLTSRPDDMERAWRASLVFMTLFLIFALPMTACGRSPLGSWEGDAASAAPSDGVRRYAGPCGDARCAESEFCVTLEFKGTPSVPTCYPREGCDLASQACPSVMCEPPSEASHCLIQTNGKETPTRCSCE
jgi:hypothetical protein